ncbi:sphingoid long-chain base transporter RSB1 [Aspergillus lentulus]|uniref:RTA1 domain-containing protein n=1 Tax=Aspergillus lentulus TaxID=293939 RepID=UPI0013924E90|nr:sphingoid long-chain base transporter RSB1 [Aspergillus lentulus]GFF26073.1 sphingoid long-chain base transporter RSB1 [Aspergillus lentulus]GFF45266.1 sphingoid long-chain base transporter RSB1 [Aspergillus lentulus]
MSNSTDPSDYCTLDTCPLSLANFNYVPNLAGNLLYLVLFGTMLVANLGLGIYYRTWGYLVGMIGGLALEVIGYVGRVQLHYNPFPFDPFLEYLICLTIGPAFLSAAIYICLGHIVVVYGEGISRLKRRTYTIIFVLCDFLSLVLQAAGGAITSTADHDQQDLRQTGINIMIAGLASQVASLGVFLCLCADFAWRVYKNPDKLEESMYHVRKTLKWKAFLIGLTVATLAIFVRSVFRVAELREGFDGPLANDEVTFMVLEGAMMVIATLCLTVLHPGYCFGGYWDQTSWKSIKRSSQLSLTELKAQNSRA